MDASALDYTVAGATIRPDLRAVHALVLEHFSRPGCWFSGRERIAIAAESRLAADCPLCRARKAALSPEHAKGEHATTGGLKAPLVELIHRVRTDSGRLSRRFFDTLISAGLTDAEYVEALGIVALTAGLDFLCRALGVAVFPLPAPLPGAPSRQRPSGLVDGIAWVPLLLPEGASGPDADVYGGADFVPNIVRALSLVPDHVRVLRKWSDAHYVPVRDLTARRAIDRPQIELVAARVSALNECFY
jgi:alkylhydroperoxidase family enzyme